MNLRKISDRDLLSETDKLVQNERELLTNLLHHLCEIERRRLFSSLGFRSLYDYAVKKLQYSEDQAYRRIQAMRALKTLPEIEEKISSGSITLSNISLAQKHFRQEERTSNKVVSKSKKLELINRIENKSAREAERIVLSLSSEPRILKEDRIKAISHDTVEIKFLADEELQNRIDKAKGLLAHSHPQISLNELFLLACDVAIEKWDKGTLKTATFKRRGDIIVNNTSVSSDCHNFHPKDVEVLNKSTPKTKSIPKATQREVWRKAQSQCEICKSQFALEIDHCFPQALGGSNEIENLRLLCRHCNQRAAIEIFGQENMSLFLNEP